MSNPTSIPNLPFDPTPRTTVYDLKDGATLRLIGRAILAGAAAGITLWVGGGATVTAIVTAAALASGEVLGPLNPFVGLGKKV